MNCMYSNTISVENYMHLRESVGFSVVSASQVQKAIDKSDFIIAVSVDNNAVGMARLITDGLQVLIMDVIVHPKYQGNGIGKSLMEHLLVYIQSLAIDDDKILINLLTDSSKTGFYEKLGFEKAEGMRLKIGKPSSITTA